MNNHKITINKNEKLVQVDNGMPFRIIEYLQSVDGSWAKFNWDSGEYELIKDDIEDANNKNPSE